jgi:hypothetical protein
MAQTDHVPWSERKKLWRASGFECARPGCDEQLINDDEDTVIGVESHIHARNPGGPRYDPDMDEDERNAFENLILLCRNDHRRVDQSPEKYTAETLRKWKEDHERTAPDGPKLTDEKLRSLLNEIEPAYLLVHLTENELDVLRDVLGWRPSHLDFERKTDRGKIPVGVTREGIRDLLRGLAARCQMESNGEPYLEQSSEFDESELIYASSIAAQLVANAIKHLQIEQNRRTEEVIQNI